MLKTNLAVMPNLSTAELTLLEAYDLIQSMTYKIYGMFRGMRFMMEREDFIQETISHFITKKYLSCFDPTIANKYYFVFIGMRNFAIDSLRKSSVRRRYYTEVSERVMTEEGEITSIYELTEALNGFSSMSYLILEETMDILSRKNGLGERYFYSDLLGEIWLCEYWVFKMVVLGMVRSDIASLLRVTEATIGNYYKRAKENMRYWYLEREKLNTIK